METNQTFAIRDLASKCRSKSELYNMLERGSDLSSAQTRGHPKSLKGCNDGKYEVLKCSQIKVANVPQYKGLTVRNILKFAR